MAVPITELEWKPNAKYILQAAIYYQIARFNSKLRAGYLSYKVGKLT